MEDDATVSATGGHEVTIGFTFFYRDARDGGHLHFVATHPDGDQVVTLNYTDEQWCPDKSCVAEAGDHPALTKRSCIAYRYAAFESVSALREGIERGDIIPVDRVSGKLIINAIEGAEISQRLALKFHAVFEEQGWFNPV